MIDEAAAEGGASAVSVAYHDYASDTGWALRGDRWFHAASTIKVPILLAVYAEIDAGRLSPDSRLHVRNRFVSAADDRPYRVASARDANAEVHGMRGKTMRVRDLARPMIATSSNLATNLLLDFVGVERCQQLLREAGVRGIELRRGVEDERAWEAGINNRVTANGLRDLFRVVVEETHFSEEVHRDILEILHGQEFRSGIPAGLPDDARVAHKTGEISTVAHDAGIVFPDGRKPYVVVVLTEWDRDATSGRRETIARISRLVYDHLTDGEGRDG
jgi:beta-lactamase class A